MQEVSPYKGIPQVDSIWKEYEAGVNFITSFDFREKVLKTALIAFGTLSFFDWCNLQNKNIYFTALHKKFLNDTFTFIETGKRSVANTTWQSLLSMKEATSKDAETVYNLNDFFRMNQSEQFRRSFRLSDAIADWTVQENGFEDLLMTIHLMFGTD